VVPRAGADATFYFYALKGQPPTTPSSSNCLSGKIILLRPTTTRAYAQAQTAGNAAMEKIWPAIRLNLSKFNAGLDLFKLYHYS